MLPFRHLAVDVCPDRQVTFLCCLDPSVNVSKHLLPAVLHFLCQDRIKDPDQLTADRYHRLLFLQRIVRSCCVILMERLEFRIYRNERYRTIEQDSSKPAPTTFTDRCLPFVLSGTVFPQRESCQLLYPVSVSQNVSHHQSLPGTRLL